MAVAAMLKVRIYGLRKNRKMILEALQRRGVLDAKEEEINSEKAEKLDTSGQINTFSKAIGTFERALEILEEASPENKSTFESLKGKKELSLNDYYTFVSETESITKEAKNVAEISKEISEKKAEIARQQSVIESLLPWKELDLPFSYKGTKNVSAVFGTYPEQKSEEEIYKLYNDTVLKQGEDTEKFPIDAEIVKKDENLTYAAIFFKKDRGGKTEEFLRLSGFSKTQLGYSKTPPEVISDAENAIKSSKERISELEKKLKNACGMRNAFKFMADYYAMRLEKYKVLSKINHIGDVFILNGFVPESDAKNLEVEFVNKYNAAVEFEEPAEDEEVPVLLKNNAFAAPCEGVLETYSLPGKGEVDPTFAMSLFYYVLFGLMLSDLAYGLIMVLGCGFALYKFKNMDLSLKKTLKMFLYCGISTAFWGAMFGGFFGDAVSVISSTYFGKEIAFKPLWFEPIKDPMKMLVFSFAIGIVHLFAGLFMKFYQCIKDKRYKDAIYDVVFWYMLVGGGIVYLLSLDMFISMTGLGFKVSAGGAKAAAICAGLGALGIVLTEGRSSKNIFKRLAKGLYGLYNVTGYLSDILSYSRLLALGLATGVIAQVFNKMGSMLGNGIPGFIMFIIVFVIGHTMNIGINLLGAYVHTNRLQFVEFFGKFYEGGGEKYDPFTEKTKYYKVVEETKL